MCLLLEFQTFLETFQLLELGLKNHKFVYTANISLLTLNTYMHTENLLATTFSE